MILRVLLVFAFALISNGCSRKNFPGVYETQGDTSKFKMTLVLEPNGTAKFTTHSQLGNPQLDQSVSTLMAMPSGKWESRENTVAVVGTRGDGKQAAFAFVRQPNGDLVWTENGARFRRTSGSP